MTEIDTEPGEDFDQPDGPLPPGLTDDYADLIVELIGDMELVANDLMRLLEACALPGLKSIFDQAMLLSYALTGISERVDGLVADLVSDGVCPSCGERHPPVKHDG